MTISNHPKPQRLVEILLVLGLLGTLFAIIGLLILGIGYGLWLMVLMIPFLIGLTAPLFLLTSLHPAIRIEETGVYLKPLVFPTSFVLWEDVVEMVEHTLVRPPLPSKLGKRKTQTGEMFIVQGGKLPFHYRVVGFMAGYGFTPVFAISDRTHLDYYILRQQMKKYLSKRK